MVATRLGTRFKNGGRRRKRLRNGVVVAREAPVQRLERRSEPCVPESDGGSNPGVRVDLVHRPTLAEKAHHSEVGDGGSVAIGRRAPVPLRGSLVIHANSAAGVIGEPDQEFGANTAPLRRTQKVNECAAHIGTRQAAIEIGRRIRV